MKSGTIVADKETEDCDVFCTQEKLKNDKYKL